MSGGRASMDAAVSRRSAIALGVLVVALLVSGVGAAYVRQGPSGVTVDDAVAQFRTAAAPPTTVVTAPEPAVTAVAPAAESAPVSTEPASSVVAAVPTTTRAGPGPGDAVRPGPPEVVAVVAAAPDEPAGTGPEEGVYTYRTEGYEETNALGGARHDYPAETPMTLRRTACGWTQRWQPLQERWDESALCRSGSSVDISRFTTFHEFFQRTQQQQFDCPPGSGVHRPGAAVGATWTWRCTAGASAIDTVVTVVGQEVLDIGGSSVAATRVRYESTMTGANRGTQRQERWMRDDGMNLRIRTDIDTESDSPFGPVHYEEHYTVTLAALQPRR